MAISFFSGSGSPERAVSGSVRMRYSLKARDEAATGAEKPTRRLTQPLRKPVSGEKSSLRKV